MPTRIEIRGVIVPSDEKWIYDWFGIEATTAKMVNDQIKAANGDDLEVIINSPGGSVFEGVEMYTALKDYPGKVTTKIVGVAASAASLPAVAGNPVLISPAAQLMIHNTANGSWGDYREHQKNAEFLKSWNKSISNAYILKTGLTQDELLALMNDETWLTAEQALEKGFVDQIMFQDDQLKLVASASRAQLIPQQIIDKMRNESHRLSPTSEPTNQVPAPQAQEGVKNNMDLEKLKSEHPDLYAQVVQEGVNQERARIKALDELQDAGNAELINKAKYETGITAPEAAVQILMAQKQKLANAAANLQNDANQSGINGVKPDEPAANNDDQKFEENAGAIANIIKQRRGVKE